MSFYMVTRRCTQRQFLLRPDKETNNAFLYCLIEAAQRFDIDVLLPCAMSNHHHTVIFDRHGNIPDFVQHFHKLLAKCQNALRGRSENMWASGPPSYVRLDTREDVLRELVYVATNPVKDRLVERAHHWPGINGLASLLYGRLLSANRPWHFFRANGKMPKKVAMNLAIPVELGDAETLLAELQERVLAKEQSLLLELREENGRVLGRRAVRRQSWRDSPSSPEPRRAPRPRIATGTQWSRLKALQRNRQFLIAYRIARELWIQGTPIPFPIGTYWLRRFANVPIVSC